MNRHSILVACAMLALCSGCTQNGRFSNPINMGAAMRVPPPRTGIVSQNQQYYNARAEGPDAIPFASAAPATVAPAGYTASPDASMWRASQTLGSCGDYQDPVCTQGTVPPGAFVAPAGMQPMTPMTAGVGTINPGAASSQIGQPRY